MLQIRARAAGKDKKRKKMTSQKQHGLAYVDAMG